MPPELAEALDTLYLCDRFKCLPSAIDAEDASIIAMIHMERRYRGE
jgi:hypothetical protein